jgi:hypothetical protein
VLYLVCLLLEAQLLGFAACCVLGFRSASEVRDPFGRALVRVLAVLLAGGSLAGAAWLAWP